MDERDIWFQRLRMMFIPPVSLAALFLCTGPGPAQMVPRYCGHQNSLPENTTLESIKENIEQAVLQQNMELEKTREQSRAFNCTAVAGNGIPTPVDTICKMLLRTISKMDENLGAALVIGMITRSILFFNNGFIAKDYESTVSEVTKASLKLLSIEQLV